MRRVAVTGIGIVSPLGNDVATFFANLAAGRSGIARLTGPMAVRRGGDGDWNGPARTHIGGAVTFDAAQHFAPPRRRMLDRVSQFALAAAAPAVSAAGIAWDAVDRERCGVFLGTGMGGAETTDDGYRTLYAERSERVKPYSVLMAMNNAAASWIGIEYGLTGPNLTYSTACSSSAVAIGEAAQRIAGGETDLMLAGGSEAPLSFGTLVAWDALKTLATEDPVDAAASCKPFAKDRTGLVLAEGAALLVLEAWDRARARGAHIHAEVAGYGLATDAAHITRPTVDGQSSAMRRALAAAQLQPEAIGYINAHGTATLANDAVETAAIKAVFGDHARRLAVSSTKSMHGHLLGAAGAMEFAAAILAMERGVLPPTINLRRADPECDLDYVPLAARHGAAPEAIMSNSFAFGGTNAVLIARRADAA
ncbi:MAG: beta-ketoacyl-[acyl-carrier-protein] synthase family protein [Betaproteobacteria bacterium]